ncbi:hypothetical protein LCGC14_1773230 [marine sediment metagenome]|uniref:Uncharacterized protein n=1 Tax=marine sediment metagenome TaxID=412755 RepID=A0A0F9JXA7_9ZZZZ
MTHNELRERLERDAGYGGCDLIMGRLAKTAAQCLLMLDALACQHSTQDHGPVCRCRGCDAIAAVLALEEKS